VSDTKREGGAKRLLTFWNTGPSHRAVDKNEAPHVSANDMVDALYRRRPQLDKDSLSSNG